MTYGLIGKTLVHSYSKEIQEALGRYTYDLISLSPEEMPGFIKAREYDGLNVTIPYKQDVIPLCDEISPLAQAIGAVNTLYWEHPEGKTPEERGRLIGHNTDYTGFLYAASRAGIDFAEKNVLILGTGGTSLTTRKAASDKGAASIRIASRHKGAEGETDHVIGSTPVSFVSYDDLPEIAESVDVIINATPVGTYPKNLQSIISLRDFPNCRGAMDVIYNPFRTALLLEAEELGIPYSNGLPMLVAQATAAAGFFLGTPGEFEKENERIITAMEKDIRNITLIGMPGSGKTTVGRHLAEISGKKFVDLDDEIAAEAGMSIPEIFQREGEEGFRKRETEVCRRFGKENRLVIAAGGGAVLRKENVQALRQNSIVIHVKRPLEQLAMDGRPLSKDMDTLRRMETERMPVYEKTADVTYENTADGSFGDELKDLI